MNHSQTQPGAEFIRLLRQAGVEADERRLAEMVWLARLMTPAEASPRPPVEEPAVAAVETMPPAESAPDTAWGPIEIVRHTYREEPANAVFVNTAVDEQGKVRVSRRRVAGVPPLPGAESLSRSLRPFHRRLLAAGEGPLDEEATARRAAESDLILPVAGPKREKWFDAAVVFEDRPAMVVWRETIREFRRLLERHGAFRDARLWRIQFPDDGEPHLLSRAGAKRDLDALADPSGRRLVFLVSDGVSAVWRDGRMRRVIEQWGERMPVVLVQLLNEAQWFRTAHGEPASRVRALRPGSPNRDLESETGGIRLPIVMLYPRSLGRWATMLMNRAAEVPALVLQPTAGPAGTPALPGVLPELSDPARELARYLSAIPLQVPVMRLVQRAMLPDSRIEHLAEVMLSGLIKRANTKQDVSALAEDQIHFDFISRDVREELQRQLRVGELDYILLCISDYLGERIGRRYDLRALIADSRGPIAVSEEEAPFARIAAQALTQHGIHPSTDSGKMIELRGIGRVRLESFSFDTVTLESRGKLVRNGRRGLSARQFVEELAPGIAIEMVEVTGGAFLMGTSPQDAVQAKQEGKRQGWEEAWVDREMPQREVNVPPFYIGKFAITQAQWQLVAEWPKIERDLDPEPSNFKGGDRPVERISWHDAQEFCARLRAKTRRAYRLPSEAEWEYACRAGTTTPFAFGETVTPEIVNYDGNYPYAKAKKGEFRNETISVGSLSVPNAFGLFDMHGNVWEWCEDVWHKNYEGAPDNGSAWLSGGDSTYRVLRGGSWFYRSFHCRSASRNLLRPGARSSSDGFRVVVVARVP